MVSEINKKNKKIPPCITGKPICRGCPGWEFMIKAQKEKNGLWGKLPIHCPIVEITLFPEKD